MHRTTWLAQNIWKKCARVVVSGLQWYLCQHTGEFALGNKEISAMVQGEIVLEYNLCQGNYSCNNYQRLKRHPDIWCLKIVISNTSYLHSFSLKFILFFYYFAELCGSDHNFGCGSHYPCAPSSALCFTRED